MDRLGPGTAVTTIEAFDHREPAEIAVADAPGLTGDDRESHSPRSPGAPNKLGHKASAGIDL
jgi:hypothetical protein